MDSTSAPGPEAWERLGEEIRKSRLRAGMTQDDLASAAGLTKRTVGNYERGRLPGIPKRIPAGYYQIARVLGWESEDIEDILVGRPVGRIALLWRESEAAETAAYGARLGLARAQEVAASSALKDPKAAHDAAGRAEEAAQRALLAQRALTEARVALADAYHASALPPSQDDASLAAALELYPSIAKFGNICAQLGAPEGMRGQLQDTASFLLQMALEKVRERDAKERDRQKDDELKQRGREIWEDRLAQRKREEEGQ